MPASVLGVSLALFAVSALIEGAITMTVMGALEAIQPNFVRQPAAGRRYALVAVGLVAVLLAAGGVCCSPPRRPMASSNWRFKPGSPGTPTL